MIVRMGRLSSLLLAAALFALLLPAACKQASRSAATDAGAADASLDAKPHCLFVDDAGVTHGCSSGGAGPGDRDDGGGAAPAPPPDASPDAINQPFGAECLDNAQCASMICYLYRVKGQFCTQLCNLDGDCPPPSPGCSGQGVCRVN